MAKSGFWLRGANGKLAGASLSKGANGETIMREIVTPKNPQTDAQKVQRIIMATVVQAYSKMKAICDHSFENLTAGAKSMNRFNALNSNMLRAKVEAAIAEGKEAGAIFDFVLSGEQRLANNNWIISSGSLPQVFADLERDGSVAHMPLTANTYQGICDLYGLKRGDQLTFITCEEQSFDPSGTFHFARIILDPTGENGEQLPMSTPFIGASGINAPSVRNENIDMTFSYADSNVNFLTTGESIILMAGVIVSRKEGDVWRRSACTLTSSEAGSNEVSLGTCLANFGTSALGVLSDRFLNNAGQGNVLEGGASSGGSQPIPVGGALVMVPQLDVRNRDYGLYYPTADGVSCPVVKDTAGELYIAKSENANPTSLVPAADTIAIPSAIQSAGLEMVIIGTFATGAEMAEALNTYLQTTIFTAPTDVTYQRVTAVTVAGENAIDPESSVVIEEATNKALAYTLTGAPSASQKIAIGVAGLQAGQKFAGEQWSQAARMETASGNDTINVDGYTPVLGVDKYQLYLVSSNYVIQPLAKVLEEEPDTGPDDRP